VNENWHDDMEMQFDCDLIARNRLFKAEQLLGPFVAFDSGLAERAMYCANSRAAQLENRTPPVGLFSSLEASVPLLPKARSRGHDRFVKPKHRGRCEWTL